MSAKSFFSSGVFYIGLGCAFLWMAYSIAADAHSAFVFLLAVLGIAVVLYGTGTQAVGSGNSGPINIAIAGGAGVLAALFGFGVLTHHKEINAVFKRTQDYGFLEFYLDDSSSGGLTVGLKNFDVEAHMGSSVRLPLYYDSHRIRIIVPIMNDEFDGKVFVTLEARSDLADIQNYREYNYKPIWRGGAAERQFGLYNEIVPEVRMPITNLVKTEVQVPSVTERNEEAGSLIVEPR